MIALIVGAITFGLLSIIRHKKAQANVSIVSGFAPNSMTGMGGYPGVSDSP